MNPRPFAFPVLPRALEQNPTVVPVPDPRPFAFPVLVRALPINLTVVVVLDPRPFLFPVLDRAPCQPFIHFPSERLVRGILVIETLTLNEVIQAQTLSRWLAHRFKASRAVARVGIIRSC